MGADNRTSVMWGVVWKLGRGRRLRLIVTDVPPAPAVRRRHVLEALELAGYGAIFAEGGVPWVNHQLLVEDRWPSNVATNGDTARVTWEQLLERQTQRTLSIRVSPHEYAELANAANGAGEKLYPWCRRALLEATRAE